MAEPTTVAKEIPIFSAVDTARVLEDTLEPEWVESCTHWKIAERIKNQPDAPAIVSWDAQFTYGEFGKMVQKLAGKLQQLGVGPEVFVPVCFPKSAWAPVAMSAIMFAGGAFATLDPTAPKERLQSILDDTQAKLVLVHPETESVLDGLNVEVFSVHEESVTALPDPESPVLADTTPDNASLIIFTSGSTGKPKGMIHTHRSMCSSAHGYGNDMHMGPGTRLFQFSAYTFDVGMMDNLTPLMQGACICIPSNEERMNDLVGVINRMKADFVFLTPTVADLLTPQEVPTLKTVCLVGEAVTKKVREKWTGKDSKVQLIGGYGPGEASFCAQHLDLSKAPRPTNIGRTVQARFWLVDPANARHLVPVGCIGELVVEGPTLARGYINVDAKNAANWIEDANWLPGEGSKRRAYKAGDLLRRNEDGTFEFAGRGDTQIKLHGQRIELGEIESRVHEFLPSDMIGVVDVVRGGESSQDTIMVFLWFTEGPNYKEEKPHLMDELSDDMRKIIQDLETNLRSVLAGYMIPSSYPLIVGQPEKSVSGKVDRKALNALGKSMSAQDKLKFSSDGGVSEPPTTATEFKLRDLWSQLLNISTEEIGKHDSFLRVGGDSVSAIQLVRLARENGISLTVATIFECPQLDRMAEAAGTGEEVLATHNLEPFSLLEEYSEEQMASLKAEVRKQSGLRNGQEVEDAYPCTKLQEGLMALAVKQPGSYIAKNIYKIPEHVDMNKFKAAWEKTVELCAILRTRVINSNGLSVQAVIKEDAKWDDAKGKNLTTFMSSTSNIEMQYGSALCRYAVVSEGNENYFVWVIHHGKLPHV